MACFFCDRIISIVAISTMCRASKMSGVADDADDEVQFPVSLERLSRSGRLFLVLSPTHGNSSKQ